MSASHERVEWHLTPRGWERGTFHHDGGVDDVRPPTDRVLTMEFDELWPSTFSKKPTTDIRELWNSGKADQIAALKKKFGLCPATL